MPLLESAVEGRRTHAAILTRPIWHLSGRLALILLLAGCGGTDPRIPSNITLSSNSVSFTAIGQTQQLSPSITDEDGNPLPNAGVMWSSSNGQVASVSQTGLVRAEGVGSATITAGAGSASAIAEVSVVQTPAQIQKISGDGQTGIAGQVLTSPLVVEVRDGGGNPVPGATVSFTVTEGDGSVGTITATTGPDGRASTTFTTGTVAGGSQTVSATIATTSISVSFTATAASDPTSFNIGLRFLSPGTPTQRQAFDNARVRWEAAITDDLPDGLLQAAGGTCGTGSPAMNQTVDDVVILVNLVEIDGPGAVLGVAGPCYIRTIGDLTMLGIMEFDTDDLEMIEAGGFLPGVILHEMGHVLGIGTLWALQGFLVDPSLPDDDDNPSTPNGDPHFTGTQAIGAFDDVGGVAYVAGAKVPVENSGGEGTADGHWRESVLDNELMTGFIGAGLNPLSTVTLASLADQGYVVDLGVADSYSLLLSLRAFGDRPKLRLVNDIFRGPIRRVDARGRVTGLLRR